MKRLIIIIIFFSFLLFPVLVLAGNTTGYAWGENIGWINFGPSQGDGVTVTNSAVTGYAWGENIGWINLNPANGGVTNDGSGNLSGYAWGENTGWINFNPSTSQVVIGGSTGDFSGYAWAENMGWINFGCTDCNVNTSWRVQIRAGRGFFYWPEIFPDSLLINAGASSTNTREVTLTLRANNTTSMQICNNPDFSGCSLEGYKTTKDWILSEGDGEKTVYVRFFGRSTYYLTIFTTIILDTTLPPGEAPEEEVPGKPIKELTLEELRQKIAEIFAQIAQLKTQLTVLQGDPLGVPVACQDITFNRNLKTGMTGVDVKCLQAFLNTSADTKLADSGPGSPDNETSYFGPITNGAVIKFQEKYAEDILAPWGLIKGTGLVGSTTRAKINEIFGG